VKRKYNQLYSNKTRQKPGRKPLNPDIIDLILEIKKRNPTVTVQSKASFNTT